MKKTNGNYPLWVWRLKVIMISQRLIKSTQKLTEDIYKNYWEEGYKPIEALKEDLGIDCIKYPFEDFK